MPRWERIEYAKHQLGRSMTRQERHCFLKRSHTEPNALGEAQRLRQRGSDVHAYRCDDCGEWHVGHA